MATQTKTLNQLAGLSSVSSSTKMVVTNGGGVSNTLPISKLATYIEESVNSYSANMTKSKSLSSFTSASALSAALLNWAQTNCNYMKSVVLHAPTDIWANLNDSTFSNEDTQLHTIVALPSNTQNYISILVYPYSANLCPKRLVYSNSNWKVYETTETKLA